jgi:hypothetical protein
VPFQKSHHFSDAILFAFAYAFPPPPKLVGILDLSIP